MRRDNDPPADTCQQKEPPEPFGSDGLQPGGGCVVELEGEKALVLHREPSLGGDEANL
jgi:hypothetical protein